MGKKETVLFQLRETNEIIHKTKKKLDLTERAKLVINQAVELTQQNVQREVESLLTMVIQSVYNRDLEFRLIIEQKRGQTQMRPVVMENGHELDIINEMGGGMVDIASFAMRLVLWSLHSDKPRPFFVLDEPMKFVGKGELLDKAGKVIREVAQTLGIQLLIVTHEPQLAAIADTTYEVTYRGDRSQVRLLGDSTGG